MTHTPTACTLLLYLLQGATLVGAQHHQHLLLEQMFTNYSKYVRPGDESLPTQVSTTFKATNLIHLDEKSQNMYLEMLIFASWNDPQLSWDPALHGDIQTMYYPQSKLWTPSLYFPNSISRMHFFENDEHMIPISANGDLMWSIWDDAKFSCDIDVSFYPFDVQNCSIQIIFSPMTLLDLVATPSMDMTAFSPGGTWELVDFSCAHYTEDNPAARIHRYSRQTFHFILRRRSTFYILEMILPVLLFSFTATVVFVLPAESGEKMGVSITVLLAYSVYLSIIADNLPQTSLQVCFFQVYLVLLLGVTALGVLLSVLVLKLHHMSAETPVGPAMALFVRVSMKICGFGKSKIAPAKQEDMFWKSNNAEGSPDIISHSESKKIDLAESTTHSDVMPLAYDVTGNEVITWKRVAHTMDKVFYIFFTVIIVIATVVIFPVIVNGGGHPNIRKPSVISCDSLAFT